MKKIYLIIIVLIFGLGSAFAQGSYSYYYKGEQIPLTLNKEFLNVTVKGDANIKKMEELGFKYEGQVSAATNETAAIVKVRFGNEPSDVVFYQKMNALKHIDGVLHVSLYFERGHGAPPIGTSGNFFVKLKNEGDVDRLKELAASRNISIVKQVPYMPTWYILSIDANGSDNALDATNFMFETGYFAAVDPAFMFDFGRTCTNDTDFGSLWGLDNSSNPSIDINACQAWTITEGLGANVAIMDQGIDVSHNDLSANIGSTGFDTQNGSSPSVFLGDVHGTHVCGTVAAIKDNNLQVVGVAPQSSILPVSHSLYLTPNISAELASGISWAWQNGAGVINNSWGDQGGAYYSQLQSAVLENAILDALTLGRNNLGTLVVFAAGNYGSGGPIMDYPGTYHSDITSVGSITSSGSRSYFSGYGTNLDVVAPGSSILSTFPYNNTGTLDGTSMASPHVTGTIALILSVNPCLTAQEVRDILESTTQKIGGYGYAPTGGRPNGTWDTEMGYGLIDAYAAVLLAQSLVSPNLDLYVKDSEVPFDNGSEPNNISPYMWNSQDIWVRVYADNGLVHQNPDYSPMSNPNTVYVRVKNKSCVTSSGNEDLKLYWAKAGTSLGWPASWDGTTYVGGQLMGDLIGTATIPVLAPGQEAIVPFSWVVPNPADYAPINSEPWHFCLLTRIDTAADPMTFPETTDLNGNVKNNNNIAWRNVTVVDAIANNSAPVGGVVAVGNPLEENHEFMLQFLSDEGETGNQIFEDADVTIKLDPHLLEVWYAGGQQVKGMQYNPEQQLFTIKANPAFFPNLPLHGGQTTTMDLKFRFKKEASDKDRFVYHVVQREAKTGRVIGGETYYINKLQEGQEPGGGVTPQTNYIAAIAPNPASESVVVKYSVTNVDSAMLAVIGSYGTAGDVMYYDIDPAAQEYNLNIADLANGFYTIALVCNGQITHVKTLVKQ